MGKMFQGFKDFIMRGNVVDLAVGVVIGAAFTTVVTSLTNGFLKPLIQVMSGGTGLSAGKFYIRKVEFDYATFINSVITFLLTAAVLYFLVVFPLNRLAERRRRGEEPPPKSPSEEVKLLTEIRDALVAQAQAGGQPHPGNVYGSAVDEVLQRRQEPPR